MGGTKYMESNEDIDNKIIDELKNKGDLAAVRLCKGSYNLRLIEAKNYVENLRNGKNLNNILREACFDGEVIYIKYNGGSQPGTVREICPISLNGNVLSAQCLTSNAEKSFRTDRLEIIDEETFNKGKKWNPNYIESKSPDRLDRINNLGSSLIDMGKGMMGCGCLIIIIIVIVLIFVVIL